MDGIETTDTTGIWQNKASAGIPMPNSTLFAWTWPVGTGPQSQEHTVDIRPGLTNAKEGGSFVHVVAYVVKP